MKLGSISTNLDDCERREGLAALGALGITSIEIACGGFFTDRRYGDPARLLEDRESRARWQDELAAAEITISALAVHGAPLSPDRAIAERHTAEYRAACELAELIGVQRITLLAGLPEARPGDRTASWIVVADPEENSDLLEWQWEERVLPYWQHESRFAEERGCKLCFEMAPSDVAHNPRGLLRLREAFGSVVGCNFDPSHLFWQGIDPLAALRRLGDVVYHAHAKDAEIFPDAAVNGVLDARPLSAGEERAWNFRVVGRGHDEAFWGDFIRTLKDVGYDDVLSIEHEDPTTTALDGLTEATRFLNTIVEAG